MPASSSARAQPFCLVTCEHAGNRIPSRYADFFRDAGPDLHSHRGYDPGALRMARELAQLLDAPLVVSTLSRLLVDLNRSIDQPDLYSEYTRALDPALRAEILDRYYLPFRTKVATSVAQAVARGVSVLHISSHSFTPQLNGELRTTDIGLLFDPARAQESDLCERWQRALRERLPHLQVHMNRPYLGTADGLTTALRRRFAEGYAGIELEISQKHVRAGGAGWAALRAAVAAALCDALAA